MCSRRESFRLPELALQEAALHEASARLLLGHLHGPHCPSHPHSLPLLACRDDRTAIHLLRLLRRQDPHLEPRRNSCAGAGSQPDDAAAYARSILEPDQDERSEPTRQAAGHLPSFWSVAGRTRCELESTRARHHVVCVDRDRRIRCHARVEGLRQETRESGLDKHAHSHPYSPSIGKGLPAQSD